MLLVWVAVIDDVSLLILIEENDDDWLVVVVWDVVVDEEISVASILVKVWAKLEELNVGDDVELDWEIEIVSDTSSVEGELEVLVWIVVSVDNVDCNEVISDSDMVTISVASLVTVDGVLSVMVWTLAVVDDVIDDVVSIDDWLTVLDWDTVDDKVVNVDSDTDTVSTSWVVAFSKYVWLVLRTVVVRVTLISVSDMVSKLKKTVMFQMLFFEIMFISHIE